ncbi:hypothetical protein [Streptomyces sp. NBC_00562]|uniref:hypothetical protein n=1 Tax=Streptomyces sp. NBC_00562 TaxID=2975777 RepID=UPI002E8155E9|nr:hypothetical protein [Streptomyces sp. NBC_00562]
MDAVHGESPYEVIGRAPAESAAAVPAVPTAMTVELKRTASAVATVRMRTLMNPQGETRFGRPGDESGRATPAHRHVKKVKTT